MQVFYYLISVSIRSPYSLQFADYIAVSKFNALPVEELRSFKDRICPSGTLPSNITILSIYPCASPEHS